MSSADTIATRDCVYYFKNVIFRVGNTIFQVPRNGFEVPGTPFEAMFDLSKAVGGGAAPEGSSDDNPIVLPVEEDHFRVFLSVMYPFSAKEISIDDWIGVLNLATMWSFKEIRQKAISALDEWVTKTQDTKEAVLLAKKYQVSSWLKASYDRLLQQTPLTMDELRSHPALDWETIAKNFYIKPNYPAPEDQRMFNYNCVKCHTHWMDQGHLCQKCYTPPQVEDVFQTEFEGMNDP